VALPCLTAAIDRRLQNTPHQLGSDALQGNTPLAHAASCPCSRQAAWALRAHGTPQTAAGADGSCLHALPSPGLSTLTDRTAGCNWGRPGPRMHDANWRRWACIRLCLGEGEAGRASGRLLQCQQAVCPRLKLCQHAQPSVCKPGQEAGPLPCHVTNHQASNPRMQPTTTTCCGTCCGGHMQQLGTCCS
jgi:hypothetical protein